MDFIKEIQCTKKKHTTWGSRYAIAVTKPSEDANDDEGHFGLQNRNKNHVYNMDRTYGDDNI